MSILDKILFIHPTKCAGTSISKRLLRLKGFSEKKSNFYSGYSFNIFFQKHIKFFYYIIHAKRAAGIVTCLFHCICFYFKIRNQVSQYKYGLTPNKGSIQHFTYKEWNAINKIKKNTICISIVSHPQHRLASSFYFLGYDKHYNFLEFLQKIKDGSLLSSIKVSGLRAIIHQHLRPMYDYIDTNGENNIDFVFKRESLGQCWQKFCQKYKLNNSPLQHINKTKKNTDWKKLYFNYPQASQLVYELYKKDFRTFGYTVINYFNI